MRLRGSYAIKKLFGGTREMEDNFLVNTNTSKAE